MPNCSKRSLQSLRIAAIDWNCFCAIGNMMPRTISVRQMIATPKFPTVWNRNISKSKMGRMKNSNQPQSIDLESLVMPASS